MNASMISTILVSLFMFFIILGFVFGWIRGLNKSLVRILMVLICAVLAFFIAPPISKAVLSMNISKLTGGSAATVEALIMDMLKKIPMVQDALNGSATLQNFILAIPQMLVNVVLFIVLFFLLKWFTMIIYWIVAGVCFNKKKMTGKEKHGFIGAVIGAVQGLIVAIVILVPCFGFVETAKPVVKAMQAEEQTTTTQNELDKYVGEAETYVKAVDNNWIVKVMGAVGVKQLSVSMFDNLTTVKKNKVEYGLRQEVKTIANVYPDIRIIMDSKFDLESEETVTALQNVVDKIYDSKVLAGTINEIVPYASRVWLGLETDENGNKVTTFFGMSKPTIKDEKIDELFNDILEKFAEPDVDIENDINVTIKLLKELQKTHIMEVVSGKRNIMDVLKLPENKTMISDIITTAVESDTLKTMLNRVVGVGMNFVYDALKIDSSTIDEIDKNLKPDWSLEKVYFQNIFNDVFDIYDQIKNSTEESPIYSLDLAKLGNVFDNMRKSTLLKTSSKQIMHQLLTSPEIVDEAVTTLDPLRLKLEEVWDDDTVSLTASFDSMGKALKLAKDMKNRVDGGINFDDLGSIVEQLNQDGGGVLKDVVGELINEDTLKDLGVDQQTAGVVSEALGAIIDHDFENPEDIQKETKAMEELFKSASDVLSSDDGDGNLSNAEALVDSLDKSDVLFEQLTKDENASKASDLLKGKLSPDAKEDLEKAIGNASQEKQDALRKFFGL